MKHCKIIAALSIVMVLMSSLAYGAMKTADFALLCSKGSPQEIKNALDSGNKPTEQILITAAYSNPNPEVINLLLSSAQRYGLDFKKMKVTGAGILNSAIRGGRAGIVRAVMSFGVNVNSKDKRGVSPLSEALRYGYKSEEPERHEIIRILREAGARR